MEEVLLPNCVVSLRSKRPPACGGRWSADSLASPGDGRTGAWPKRRATRHDAGSARGERLRIEREEELGDAHPALPERWGVAGWVRFGA